jgi:hypothetical protein
MTIFDRMGGAFLRDPHLATAATYTPEVGAAREIRAVDLTDGVKVGDGEVQAFATVIAADVAPADVADPPTGGTLALGGVAYRIVSHEARTPLMRLHLERIS